MKEKVIDIIPPLEKEKKEYYKKEKKGRKKIFIPIFIFLVSVLGYFYYTSYRTEIIINPVTETLTEERSVLARSVDSVGQDEIRAKIFEERIKGSREFTIEERRIVEEKAEGKIEVCQDYSDAPVSFVQGTRFVSDKGKLFLAEERVNLPGRTYEEGNIVAGCAEIDVVAAEPGEDYNISSASKFSLPGLHGSAYYGRVKGESFSLEKEGFFGEVPYLGEEERGRMEKEIVDELFTRGVEKIKENYKESYLFEGEMQYRDEIIERHFAAKENDEEKAILELELKIEAIAVKNEDIEDYLLSLLPENYIWESKETKYSFSRVNFESKEMEFDLEFSAKIYKEIDKEDIKRRLAGVSFDKAEEKIKEEISAEWVHFRTLPFGLQRISENPERISIVLRFDKK